MPNHPLTQGRTHPRPPKSTRFAFGTDVGPANDIPQILRIRSKRMPAAKRTRGGQPGNFNALKHGRRSPRKRAQRRALVEARLREEQARSAAWAARMPKTDYGAICDAIRCRRGPESREDSLMDERFV